MFHLCVLAAYQPGPPFPGHMLELDPIALTVQHAMSPRFYECCLLPLTPLRLVSHGVECLFEREVGF